MKKTWIIFIILSFLISNDRQNNLEKHIQCPCNKGLLVDHYTSEPIKIKKLLSLLIQDSIQMDAVKDFIQKEFVKNLDHQMCLIGNIEQNLLNNRISDDGIYNLIGDCYGQHLIKDGKNNSLIYIILFIIITVGGLLSITFIIRNKKGRL
jgi:hypothetical protein